MKLSQKPLTIAYIAFLFICILYYIASNLFNLEFVMWERIIVAATMASFFFSITMPDKSTIKHTKKNLDLFQNEKRICQRIKNAEEKLSKKEEVKTGIEKNIANIDKSIRSCKQRIKKGERNILICEVLGYLLFFCIISFQYVYQFFAAQQEVYTLMAFAFVIAMNYLEEIITEQREKEIKEIKMQSSKNEDLLNTIDSIIDYVIEPNIK